MNTGLTDITEICGYITIFLDILLQIQKKSEGLKRKNRSRIPVLCRFSLFLNIVISLTLPATHKN